MLDCRIARVGIGHPEKEAFLLRQLAELPGFGFLEGEGFVADDMDARVEESLGDRIVQRVRRHDRYKSIPSGRAGPLFVRISS